MKLSYRYLFTLLFLGWISILPVSAQEQSRIQVTKSLSYRQPVAPMGTDNYLFSTYYFRDKKAYNMKGFEIGSAPYGVVSIKYNPSGTSFALLSEKKEKSSVVIYDAWETGRVIHEFVDVKHPTSISYSADSKQFYISDDRQLNVYDSKTFRSISKWSLPLVPKLMVTSSNGYFLAAAGENEVAIVNQETGSVRTNLRLSAKVNEVQFSDDSSLLGVLTSDGQLTIYDTRSFSQKHTYSSLGSASSLAFHPEGKYVTVLISGNQIRFINMKDSSDTPELSEPEGNVSCLRYLLDGKNNTYLTYVANRSLIYKKLAGFLPNYSRMLTDELTARMSEWAVMRADETFEEYKERVNEESRLQQKRLLEQEIATRMAGDLVSESEVQLGSYNPENNMLKIVFDKMPQIFLTVPEEEVVTFKDSKNLEFRDVVYGLNEDDKFEITYANVYNRATGKTYEFNNLQRESLDFLMSEEDFVPIEVVQQASMEESKLGKIKEEVVGSAVQRQLISDHTQIKVGTNVFQDYDADGKKIMNYKVSFDYAVEKEYSIKEDFAPGKYLIEQSHAALSMLDIITQAFQQEFQKYLVSGKKLNVKLTGSADAMKISGVIPYDGCYGEFENEPYRLDNNLNAMTVTSRTGVRQNEQLAFLRAAGVKDYIAKKLPSLQQMNTSYLYSIELPEGTGGEFRRIKIEFVFVDAF